MFLDHGLGGLTAAYAGWVHCSAPYGRPHIRILVDHSTPMRPSSTRWHRNNAHEGPRQIRREPNPPNIWRASRTASSISRSPPAPLTGRARAYRADQGRESVGDFAARRRARALP